MSDGPKTRATDTRSLTDVATDDVPADGEALVWDDAAGLYAPSAVEVSSVTVEAGHVDGGAVLWRWGIDPLGRPYFDDTDGAADGEEAHLIVDDSLFYAEEVTL